VDRAVARFRELGEQAAECGVLAKPEMHDTCLETADSSVDLVEAIGISLHRPVESWVEPIEKTMPLATFRHVKN